MFLVFARLMVVSLLLVGVGVAQAATQSTGVVTSDNTVDVSVQVTGGGGTDFELVEFEVRLANGDTKTISIAEIIQPNPHWSGTYTITLPAGYMKLRIRHSNGVSPWTTL